MWFIGVEVEQEMHLLLKKKILDPPLVTEPKKTRTHELLFS